MENIKVQIEKAVNGNCKDVAALIKASLKARTGRSWSVKIDSGSAYGWLTIASMPKDFNEWSMKDEDRKELATALGLDYVHNQGEKVPPQRDFYRVALARAMTGTDLGYTATPNWNN